MQYVPLRIRDIRCLGGPVFVMLDTVATMAFIQNHVYKSGSFLSVSVFVVDA